MKKLLLTLLLPVLLCTGQLAAQTYTALPATQGVDCGGTATITVSTGGAQYYATTSGGLVIIDEGVEKPLLLTNKDKITVRATSGGGTVSISLASNPDDVVATATVTIKEIPVGNYISSSSIGTPGGISCLSARGGSATYSLPYVDGAHYLWQIVQGGAHTKITNGGDSNTITVESINEGNSYLHVYIYNDCTGDICAATQRGVQIKKIFSLDPSETFGGPECLDASTLGDDNLLVYSVKPYIGLYNSYSDYNWTLSAGLEEAYRSADGSSISVRVIDATTDQQVKIVVGSACNGGNNTLIKKLKAPAPEPTFESNSLCVSDIIGSTAIFRVTNNPEGKFSYQWILPENWSIVGSNGPNNTEVTVRFDNTGTGNITVVASHDGCGAKFSTISVNRFPAAAAPISGPNCVAFASQNLLRYSVTGGGNNTYTWEVLPADAGWEVGSSNGATIDILPKFANLPTSGEVEVRATIQGNCGTAPVVSTLKVKVGADKPGAITGDACVKYGETSVTYSIPAVGDLKYKWDIPTGWSVLSTKTDEATITVNPGNLGGEIGVQALGCGDPSAATTKTVTIGPKLPGDIDGKKCLKYNEVNVTYTVPAVDNAEGYTWEVPAPWTHTISTDKRTITVTYTGNVNRTIRVKANGCVAKADSEFTELAISIGPDQPGEIAGKQCIQSTGDLVYEIAEVPNASGYLWDAPSDWVFKTAKNGRSVTITPGKESGKVTVIARGCNAQADSPARELDVTVAPATPTTISYNVHDDNNSTINTCIGKGAEQTITFTTAAVANAKSYTWTFPASWGGEQTTTSPTVIITTDLMSDAEVSVTANSGTTKESCRSAARTLQANRSGLEFCVDIFQPLNGYKGYSVDEATASNLSNTYIWRVGTPASGPIVSTESAYFASRASLAGRPVYVIITDVNGCTTTLEIPGSKEIGEQHCTSGSGARMASTNIAARQLVSSEATEGVKLFPNPSADDVNIVLPEKAGKATIRIYSIAGKLINTIVPTGKDVTVDVREYHDGMYLVIVHTTSGIFNDKFVVKH